MEPVKHRPKMRIRPKLESDNKKRGQDSQKINVLSLTNKARFAFKKYWVIVTGVGKTSEDKCREY